RARLMTSRRSIPRPARASISSMAACPYFRCAFFSKRTSLRSLRALTSRSINSATRSSKLKAPMLGCASWSSRPAAMPSSFSVRSCASVVCIIIVFSLFLLVVAGATHVGMVGADPVAGNDRRALVTVIDQDVAHVAVLAGADLQGQRAGRLKPDLAVALGQRQQP